jgi:GR25 family glycosyltransferase involved in LPS biosynthesis
MTSSIIDNFFDKIYYINLKKDFDRNINILKEFEKFNIRNFQRMEGVEISDLPDQWLYRSFIKKDFKYIKGALGCRSAHLNIIRDAKNNNYKNIAIFEDDISFTIDPNALIQGNLYNIQNFDLLYFGGLQEQHFNNQIVQTHAMGISCKIFDDILYMAESSGMEIDNFYAKIIQQMSKNTRVGGKCLIKKIEPFNSVIQLKDFISNINTNV